MVWIGFVVGQFLGWTTLESLFVGAIIAISSTTIIAKAFDEQGIRGPVRELVVGVLVALLLKITTAVSRPIAKACCADQRGVDQHAHRDEEDRRKPRCC